MGRKAGLGSVSDGVLTGVLHDLQTAGIVQRELYGEVPPRVEYTLTEKGEDLLREVTETTKKFEEEVPTQQFW